MADEQAAPKSEKTTNELAEERTDLARKRTIIAADRTLMAWIRTSISMISFGFTIYKFFEYFTAAGKVVRPIRPHAPRNLGLSLISLGVLGLVMATIQYRQLLKSLDEEEDVPLWTTSFIVALFMILIGLLAFLGVWLHAGPY